MRLARPRQGAWLSLALLMSIGSVPVPAQTPTSLPYVKKATWRESWEASLQAMRQTDVAMGPWHYVGPFDNAGGKGFDAVYPPEREVDLSKSYPGKGGKEVQWQKGEKFADGRVNGMPLFDNNEHFTVYLYRTLHARKPTSLGISLGSDDTLTVWLNGERLLARNVTRACAPDQEFLTLALKAGDNGLLLEVCQGAGPWGFYFARADSAVLQQALLERLIVDFPDAETEILVEMDWKRQDGVADSESTLAEAVAKHLKLARLLLEDLKRNRSPDFLAAEAKQLEALETECSQTQSAQRGSQNTHWDSLYLRVHHLKRYIAFKNPLLDSSAGEGQGFDQLLFVKRLPGTYSHMCDQYFGRNARPGGGVFILESLRHGGPSRNVVGNQLPEGSFLSPVLSYDARRILFAYRKGRVETPEDAYYHLYEINVDGTGLHQLTSGSYDDFDGCYLPSGQIVFVSTRRGGYGRCHGRPVPLYTLHLMEADGSNLHTLSFNEANEWNPSVLDDGRIVYTRWDYVDRHAVLFQSLWTILQDGTNPQALYGNNSPNPNCTFHPRQIPGSHKVCSLAGAHHSFTAGSVITVDNRAGFDGLKPVTRITPEVAFPESEGWPQTCYETPYPLSESYYLAAYSFDPIYTEGRLNPPNQFGLYLVDRFGNRELLSRDPAISSISPIPLAPRKKPPALSGTGRPGGQSEGTFVVLNVYEGIEKLAKGSVKALRVVRILPKQTPLADGPRMGLAGQETGKLVLGTVPVEPDGSAYFKAPARVPLLFQTLDQEGMAIHTMRSLTYLQPGETLTCIGCHEPRNLTPSSKPVEAARRPPSLIRPAPDGSAPLSFPRLVQPVLDKHCISCHNANKPEAKPVLTGEPTQQFTRSYEALMNLGGEMVSRFAAWNGVINTSPDTFGARGSKLIRMLKAGHYGVKLDKESWERLATWLDSNALFYGTFLPEEQAKQQRGELIAMPNY